MTETDPALTLRHRPFWEALDGGVLLFRRWAPLVAVFYGLPLAWVAAGLAWAFGTEWPWLPVVILWWLRPLFARLILGSAGTLFFAPQTRWRDLGPAVLRAFDGSLVADLTWRRFSPWATYLASVSFLERSARKDRQRRRRWVGRDLGWPLVLAATAFAVTEAAVAFSVWATVSVVTDQGLWGASSASDPAVTGAGWAALAAVTQLLVEPLFVLSCFSLYLNTRTRAEGWDLSLAFRNLRRGLGSLGPTLAVLLVLGASLGFPAAAGAFEVPSADGPAPAQAEVWQKVVDGPDFGTREPSWTLKWKHPKDASSPAETENKLAGFWGNWGPEVLRGLAIGLGVAAALGLAGYAGWAAWGRRRPGQAEVSGTGPPSGVSSPELWDAAVRGAWAAGRPREAVALLYQAALDLAVRRHGLTVPRSATEGECLRLLRSSSVDPDFSRTLGGLVALWSEVAWGGRLPAAERFEALVTALAPSGRAP